MDKIKKLWEEKKIVILILLLLLLLIGFILTAIFTKGFGLFESDSSSTSSKIGGYDLEEMDDLDVPGTFTEGNYITTFGRISDLQDSYSFILITEDRSLNVYIYDLEDYGTRRITGVEALENDDYVVVQGAWSELYHGIMAETVEKLNPALVEDFLSSKIPMLDIEILDYTENITHTCITPVFNIRLTNTGQIPITHRYLHTTEYATGGYRFYYFIDDDHSMANANREDYDETMADIDDPEYIGLLSRQGFLYFDDILPGQSVKTEYWAGGQVTQSLHRDMFNDDGTNRRAGVGGSRNIFGNYDAGEYEFTLVWSRMNNYDDVEFLNRSNTVTVNLLDDNCSLDDQYITDTFWVEPL